MRASTLSILVATLACGGASDGDEVAGSTGSASSTSASTENSTSQADASTSIGESTGVQPPSWAVVAELGPEVGMAMSVWGPTADLARVVGGQLERDGSTGFVLRREGADWIPETLPADTPMLHWVGPAGDDVWAVGRDGAALRDEGGTWVSFASSTEVDLWGVWGAAADDVWAVGGGGAEDLPTLLHFDGTAWSLAELPDDMPRSSNALFKVWGADAEHVFVVGEGGVALDGVGPAWNPTYAESIAPFIAVRGRSADDVVAVGGRSNARIARFDGTGWQDTTLIDPGLNGVWVDADGIATLVGRLGGIYELPSGSLEPTVMESPTLDLLHAVHGFEDGRRIAVGGTFDGAPPWSGVILEHPG
jgi:hypothetical protein